MSWFLNRNAFEITPVEFVQLNHACHDYSMSSCESNLKLENVIVETEAQQLIKRAKAKELYDVCY